MDSTGIEVHQKSDIVIGRTLTEVGQAADAVANEHIFADHLSRKSASTLQAYAEDIRRWDDFIMLAGVNTDTCDWMHDPSCWQGVTAGLVKSFRQLMINEGYAVSTINRRLATVRTFCRLAHEAHYIGAEEASRISLVAGYRHKEGRQLDGKREVTRLSSKKRQPVRIGKDQAAQLKDRPDTPQGRRDAVVMCLLLDHGLRAGELSKIVVESVSLDAGTIRFDRPKVDRAQVHELSSDTMAALRRYRDFGDCPSSGLLLRKSYKDESLGTQGMDRRSITALVGRLGDEIGLSGLSAHDCRHYWATYWAKRVDPFQLQTAGGWSSMEKVLVWMLGRAHSADFYQQRYNAFDSLARILPEPFASYAFQILANGTHDPALTHAIYPHLPPPEQPTPQSTVRHSVELTTEVQRLAKVYAEIDKNNYLPDTETLVRILGKMGALIWASDASIDYDEAMRRAFALAEKENSAAERTNSNCIERKRISACTSRSTLPV